MSDTLIWHVQVMTHDFHDNGHTVAVCSNVEKAKVYAEQRFPQISKWEVDEDEGFSTIAYYAELSNEAYRVVWIFPDVIDPPSDIKAHETATLNTWARLQGITE